MKKVIKEIVVINLISLALIAAFIVAVVLSKEPLDAFAFIFPIWILTIIPSYAITIIYLRNKSFEESFIFGFRMGLLLDWSAPFLPAIIAPYLAYKYYQYQIKTYKFKKLYGRDF